MNKMEIMAMRMAAVQNRREQIDAVSAAILKLSMLNLTWKEGMVECPPPSNINPLRWRAMLSNFVVNNGII